MVSPYSVSEVNSPLKKFHRPTKHISNITNLKERQISNVLARWPPRIYKKKKKRKTVKYFFLKLNFLCFIPTSFHSWLVGIIFKFLKIPMTEINETFSAPRAAGPWAELLSSIHGYSYDLWYCPQKIYVSCDHVITIITMLLHL